MEFKDNYWEYGNEYDYKYSCIIYVRFGKSIQYVINLVLCGDLVDVVVGIYSEQFIIDINGIQFISYNFIIVFFIKFV